MPQVFVVVLRFCALWGQGLCRVTAFYAAGISRLAPAPSNAHYSKRRLLRPGRCYWYWYCCGFSFGFWHCNCTSSTVQTQGFHCQSVNVDDLYRQWPPAPSPLPRLPPYLLSFSPLAFACRLWYPLHFPCCLRCFLRD